MYKEDLALNNQQWLICHKTKPNYDCPVGHMAKHENLTLNNLQWLICYKTKPNYDCPVGHMGETYVGVWLKSVSK